MKCRCFTFLNNLTKRPATLIFALFSIFFILPSAHAHDGILDLYFEFTTQGWDGSVENGQCGPSGTLNGNSGWASTPIAGVYFDDTDNRAGGCPQSYRVVSAGSASVANKFRVCRNVTQSDGNGQCGAIGTSCSEWTGGAGAWSAPYGDDTDNRSGWCQVQFLLQEYITSPADAPYVFRLKVESYATPGSDNTQCQGVTQQHPALEYTGWTHAPAWTTGGILDDTDKRGGGCQRRWTVERTQRPGWVAKCANSLDDDADGWIDLEDPGCANSQDNDEGNGAVSQCSDRIDNDSDGFIDSGDPDCANGFDNLEQGPAFQRPVCPGGVTPQVIDIEVAPARAFQTIQQAPGTVWATNTKSIDPQNGDRIFVSGYSLANTNFASHYSNFYAEFRTPYAAVGQQYVTANCKRAIGNSLPVEISGLFLGPLNPNANPTNFTTKQIDVCGWGVGGTPYYVNIFRCQKPQCADQIDNDLDNMTDLYDPGCANANDNDELNNLGTQCSDGIDNDGDGFIDLSDAGCEGLTDTTESPRPPAVGCTTVTNGAIPSSFYQSFENYSPINNTKCGPYSYFHLENFSDGAFNTPGIVAGTDDPKIGLEVFGADSPPNANGYPVADYIDSVLADGATSIEGYCNIKDKRCSSFFFRPHQVAATGPYTNTMFMTFKCNELTGGCPTHAGFVWTDGAVGQTLNVKWYTPSGVLIAETNEVVGAQNFSYQGSAGEDKFFGAVNPGEGIGKVVLRTTHPTIEVGTEIDHIQYGRKVFGQCSDGIDNDGDGKIDFPADPGCSSATDASELDDNVQCDDGADNDGDGKIDFNADGSGDPGCTGPTDESEKGTTACDDAIDNDNDLRIDFPTDKGCFGPEDTTETDPNGPACDNGKDDDSDLLTDFAKDPGCSSPDDTTETDASVACDDDKDNDGDSLIDFPDDPGCTSPTDESESNPNVPACRDGIDNDGDGKVDFPTDPGCSSANDLTEFNTDGPACDNWKDDDGDNLVDSEDPGCSGPTDDNETDPNGPVCSNGKDDDGDGLIDYPKDPGCSSRDDSTETNANGPQCDNAKDDDADGKVDYPADAQCTSPVDDNEAGNNPECKDGIDNDKDGLTDFPADPGCSDANDGSEDNIKYPECDNGIDDDGDGYTDYRIDGNGDPGCDAVHDNDESDAQGPACDNNIDDDGDLRIDFPTDPGCTSVTDDSEDEATGKQCDDGKDNDGDGLVDFPADPGCVDSFDDNEKDTSTNPIACDDGKDNDGDGLIDYKVDGSGDPGCFSAYDTSEDDPNGKQCDDGKDNDGDNKIDYRIDSLGDPGCTSVTDDSEADPATPTPTSTTTGTSTPTNTPTSTSTMTPIVVPPTPTFTPTLTATVTATPTPVSGCADGVDNDGDGKTDFPADPGCSSAGDNDETDKFAIVAPVVNCVYDNQNGSFTAVLGYQNFNASEISIAAGTSPAGVNSFTGQENRGQTTTFAAGKKDSAFSFVFDGNSTTWTLGAAESAQSTVTVSKTSPACTGISPTVSCINIKSDGSLEAKLGYKNSNTFEVSIPAGALNGFVPAPADRGQPTKFMSGTFDVAVNASFAQDATLSWNIGTNSISVDNKFRPFCPETNCSEVNLVDEKKEIDQISRDMAQLAKDAANELSKLAAKDKDKRGQEDARRASAKANQFLTEVQTCVRKIVSVQKTCSLAPDNCVNVSNGVFIGCVNHYETQLQKLTARFETRLVFRKTGKFTRTARQRKARELLTAGLKALESVPKVQVSCTN